MKLQTTIPVSPQSNPIDYNSNILLLGSCFAETIGGQLEYFKFQNLRNPFGVIFNPVSMLRLMQRALGNEAFTFTDFFQREDQWFCFETHSQLTATTRDELVVVLNAQLEILRQSLETATHVVLTFGTAWVYRHVETGAIVANCHKLPQQQFAKELLPISEISEALRTMVSLIKKKNPKATIITTVSPVRHLKDGFVENTRSKSHLLVALHTTEGIYYFPSYEIMMDELRDYRFYDSDLLHPNDTAIAIIWDRFKRGWVASETEEIQKEIDTIQKGLQHRPFVPESASHKAFQKTLQNKIKAITQQLPHIEFGSES